MKTPSSPAVDRSDLLRLDGRAVEILDSLGFAVLVADRRHVIRFRSAAAGQWLPSGTNLLTVLTSVRLSDTSASWPTHIQQVLGGQTLHLTGALQGCQSDTSGLLTIRCTPWQRAGTSGPIRGTVLCLWEAAGSEISDERMDVSKRLASLGRLAARVTHELNNPLDGVLRYLNLAIRTIGEPSEPKVKAYLSEAKTGLLRMVQIIGDLLKLSREAEGEFDERTVNEVVEEAIRTAAAEAESRRIVVAVDFQTARMPAVAGSRLYQVCCNLIKNAVDAMPDGGRLCVTTGIVGEDVVLRVADTGVGLPADIDKVFEPFYTTKPPGKGTGLGLAICKDFVEELQGTIRAERGEECGAVFTVRIPVCSFERAGRGSVTPASPRPAPAELLAGRSEGRHDAT
jgi:signal transduction histidine kinase